MISRSEPHNKRLWPTALRRGQIGGHTRFAAGFMAKALSRTRAAAEPRAVMWPIAIERLNEQRRSFPSCLESLFL